MQSSRDAEGAVSKQIRARHHTGSSTVEATKHEIQLGSQRCFNSVQSRFGLRSWLEFDLFAPSLIRPFA